MEKAKDGLYLLLIAPIADHIGTKSLSSVLYHYVTIATRTSLLPLDSTISYPRETFTDLRTLPHQLEERVCAPLSVTRLTPYTSNPFY